jgi:hypothetical protein
MRPYLVVFRNWDPTSTGGGRAAWVERQDEAAGAAAEGLRAWVRQNGLEADLGRIGGATVFGSVGIVATKELVARLRRWDEVEAVIPANP